MDDVAARIADLSPEKRALLEKRLLSSKEPRVAAPAISPRAEAGPALLSFAQQRLWFLDRLDPGKSLYNVPEVLRLRGALDAKALEGALQGVVDRHRVLRTAFFDSEGEPLARVEDLRFRMPVTDLTVLPPGERETEAHRLAAEESETPFDLAKPPLLRGRLLRLAADDHWLLLTVHHIVSDDWSMGVLFAELSELYAARLGGRPPDLIPPPIQYSDYAAWQRDWLQGPVLERQLSYWREKLGGELPVLALPIDHPRPALRGSRGSEHRRRLSPRLTEALESLSRREGATLFMTLLAAFQVLLSRYSGQDDVLVGTPIAGRNRLETESLVGFFVNTLVMRGDLSGDPTFRELLGRTRETALEAYAHQDLPFERLVEDLRPERSLSHSPIFQVMFDLDSAPEALPKMPGLRVDPVELPDASAKFDLQLFGVKDGGELLIVFEYATDLFDETTISRMAGHFEMLLEGITADPLQRISRLPLLTPAEGRQIRVEWNNTEVDYPREKCVHHLFEEQAGRTPEAVAVEFDGGESLTYRELDFRSNQLAEHLRRLGVGPEVLVGLSVLRSPEMVVGLLGILKAGGAYVPFDPTYPAERLSYMLEDSGVSILLTTAGLDDVLPSFSGRRIRLDADWDDISRLPGERGQSRATAENLAYVMYTSGSTGRPKGVMLEHGGVVNRLLWMEAAYRLNVGDRVLQKTAFSFDVSVWEFFWPLLSGARLVLARPGGSKDPRYLLDVIRRAGITVLHFVPSMLQAFLEASEDFSACAGLRHVFCSGEALPFALQERFFERMPPGISLHNLYGPTEASVDVTFWDCSPDSSLSIVPIGRPVANTRLYVVDRHDNLLPTGVPGELLIGGVGVARGYLNRPELTAEKFIPDAFGGPARARLYRSGDLVRWLPSGDLEYLGRIDQQVKIRGFRVELGEIEGALREHAIVREAVVALREDASGDRRLVGYVVTKPGLVWNSESLRRHLRDRLPEYMVPSALVRLESLPVNANGKVDRKALPSPDWRSRPIEREHVGPRTPLEQTVAGIWRDLLRVDEVGVDDNFFDLGGHSLLATQVVSRIRRSFSLELPLRVLFESPTVAELSRAIAQAQAQQTSPEDPARDVLSRRDPRVASSSITPRGTSGPAPLSFAQQRLWFLDQLDPGKSVYNVPEAHCLRGRLDTAALERALQEIVRRHEVLRTSFGLANGEPRAAVQEVSVELPVTDLSRLAGAEREAQAQALTQAEGAAPFDLARAPLFRARLLRLAPEEHWLVLTMHHIVSDRWSMGVLFSELEALYAAEVAGQKAPLPPLPIQYDDFAVWQRGWLRDEVLGSQLAYWKTKLSGDLPVLALPTDHSRPAIQSYRGAEHRRRLSPRLTAELEALSRREGASLFMTLLAAFQALLSRYSGQEDVLVGTLIAGRNRIETENLIGFFVNTLVLRTDLSGEPTFRELLGRVRNTALEAYAHQDLPFERLVEELRPERSLSHSPIIQAMFELDNGQGHTLALRGLAVEPVELHDASAKFDLSLLAVAEEEGLVLVFEYVPDLFDEATIARMAGHLETMLEGMAADPSRPVFLLPLLTETEKRQILVEWNDTDTEYPREKCVHHLFEEQAGRTPGAVAVEFDGGESLTYRELDFRSNQLAEHLRRLGVGPEVLVGLSVPRSPEMVVGLLGILKAGGAYVPFDPTYPAERLSYMLEDSKAAVLITVEDLTDVLPPFSGRTVRLDSDWEEISRLQGEPGESGVAPENLAYVMYTSGSTGRPKGVMIPHRGVVNYLSWAVRHYPMDAGRGAPVQSSLSFDLTITGLLGPLLCGRRVRLLPEGFAIEALGSVLREEGDFSLVKITPTRLDLLKQQIQPEQAAGGTRAFVIGGEPLRAESLSFWRDFASATAIFNEYGPTETVVGCCVYRVKAGDPTTGPVPIGRPIANTRLYVLDRHRQPLPIGVTGELYIGGDGVGRGYWNRPDLTAERFLQDPFSDGPGKRLYRTGDLVRYRTDGDLEFLGRTDDQVKIRGFRVELGEIESVIREHASVREAAVELREDVPGDRRLVAYVVTDPSREWSADALRLHLRERLPEFMVPFAFVRLEALPVTRNGKLDRKALPSPDWRRRQLEDQSEPPADALELRLARIWETVLGAEPIGVEDDFFDLGGHSLLAVRLFTEIEKATGKKLPLATLFQAPTVRQLAGVLRERGWSSPRGSLVPIQPRGTRPPFYCVHAAGGSVMPYRALATRLGPEQPFYGLQARGLDDTSGVPERLEDMAEAYLAEVRNLQPEGPYYIGGHSAGGLVAYEMARRLRAQGQEVALVALFDTWAPGHGELIPEKYLRARFEQFRARLARFFRHLAETDKIGYLREKLAIRVRVLVGRTSTLPPKLQELRDAIEDAADNYRPKTYGGRVTLFRAARQPSEYSLDRSLGWGDLAQGGVEVHEVPGYHGGIVQEPQASILAEQLRECLDRAIGEEHELASPAGTAS